MIKMGKDVSTDILSEESIDSVVTKVDEHKNYLKTLPEVQALTDQIDVTNLSSIIEFGNEASVGLSTSTDQLLAITKKIKSDNMTQALLDLAKILDNCDLKSLTQAMDKAHKPSVLDKVKGYYKKFHNLISKYEVSTKEVDRIKVILDGYKNDLRLSNMSLEQHKLELLNYFTELEKYIVAAEIGLQEILDVRGEVAEAEMNTADKTMQLQALDLAHSSLRERLMNLRAAEAVAMQSVPLIRTMQESNLYLYNKIETQFIVTLPIFKSSLLQAIELRRQKAITDSLSKVDEVTNKLLEANAKNTIAQSIAVQNMASKPTIKIETLETTYKIIQDGLTEIERLNIENNNVRLEASNKLTSMKSNFQDVYLLGDGKTN